MSQRNPGRRGFYGGDSSDTTDESDSDESDESDTGGTTSPIRGEQGQTDATDEPQEVDTPSDVTNGDSSQTEPGEPTQNDGRRGFYGDNETDDPTEPDTGGTTSPIRGEQGQTDATDEPQEVDTPGDVTNGDSSDDGNGSQTYDPTDAQTSPVRGQPRPSEQGDTTPEGISGSEAGEIQEQVAGGISGVFASDVTLEREELSQSERDDLRQEIADERGVDVERIEFEETPFRIEADISAAGEGRAAETEFAREYDVDLRDIDAETTDDGVAITPRTEEGEVAIISDQTGTPIEQIESERSEQEFDREEAEQELQDAIEGSEDSDVPQPGEQEPIGQTTDPTYREGDQPRSFSEALINTETAATVSSAGSFISGGIVEGLQDAGEFIASGEGSGDAGIAGDVVGGGFEGRAEGLADTVVVGPFEDTAVGGATESAIVGAFGTAPGAIAQAPGDVALLGRRTEQAGRTIARDPGTAGDVAATAAGFGAAGVSGTASAVASAPIREGVAIGALLGGTAGAAAGARTVGSRVSRGRSGRRSGGDTDTTVRASDRIDEPGSFEGFRSGRELSEYVPGNERAQGTLLPRGRTRQREITEDDIAGRLDDPEQPGPPMREIAERRAVANSRDRYEGVTGPSARGARRRQRRAERSEVIDGGPPLSRLGGAAGGLLATDVDTDQSIGSMQDTGARSGTEQTIDILSEPTTDTSQRTVADQDIATVLISSPEATTTTVSTPGTPGTPSGGTPRSPGIPSLPDLVDTDSTRGLEDTEREEFGDIDVGTYIDPI